MTTSSSSSLTGQCALITGAARRIGAAIATTLHAAGANIAIHYRSSSDDAEQLCADFNKLRKNSAAVFKADLQYPEQIEVLAEAVVGWHDRLDILVNNASTFYPTPLGSVTQQQWNDLLDSNLKAPLFLSQAALPALRKNGGNIVNIVDIHAVRPLRDHAVYGSAKAGLAMLTRSLAKDLAPQVRVNAVAPGAIMWPEDGMTEATQQSILEQIPLARQGAADDIAGAVLYLVRDASYVTGQILAVDGGRSLGW